MGDNPYETRFSHIKKYQGNVMNIVDHNVLDVTLLTDNFQHQIQSTRY
jgi:hypothetical protein